MADSAERERYRFFLGGRDLEMLEISRLLAAHAPGQIEDKALSWGAKASSYGDSIVRALARGEVPVLVELAYDLCPDAVSRERIVELDHHGTDAGVAQPTALEQIFGLLALDRAQWTRRLALVAANDRGHIAAMKAELAASAEEISLIRKDDRRAQGITQEYEARARTDIERAHSISGLTIIETQAATGTAIVDLMHPDLGGPGFVALLVSMPDKATFFGPGPAVEVLARRFQDSWYGGYLPHQGYWGCAIGDRASRQDIVAAACEALQQHRSARDP